MEIMRNSARCLEQTNKILDLLESTGRSGMDKVIALLEEKGFFAAPASIRFQNNYEGGLADHSFSVYSHAMRLRDEKLAQNPNNEDLLPLDSVIIVSLLHDVCKSDVYHKAPQGGWFKDMSSFPAGHGEKSVIMLLQAGLHLTPDEILAIRWHMGRHELKEGRGGQEAACCRIAEKTCPLLRLLQRADGMAANERNQ